MPVSSDLTAVFFVDEERGWAVGHDGVDPAHRRRRRHAGACSSTVARRTSCCSRPRCSARSRPSRPPARRSAARRSAAPRRAGPRQAVPRRLVRRRRTGLRRRRLQPHLPHRRRRQELDAVVRPHRQSRSFSTFTPSVRPRASCSSRARRARAEARRRGAAVSRRSRSRTTGQLLRHRPARRPPCSRYGLRGNVYRSDDARRDAGPRSTHGLPATVVGSARTSRGASLLADVGGRVVVRATDGGRTFATPLTLGQAMPLTGLADAGGRPLRAGRVRAAPPSATQRHAEAQRQGPGHAWQRTTDDLDADAGGARPRRIRPPLRQPARAAGVQQPAGRASSLCAILTLVLGYAAATKLVLNASFEKMIPQSQPYIKNYLTLSEGPARPRQRAARRRREPRRRHLRPRVPRGAEADQRRARRSRPASTAPGSSRCGSPAVRWTEVTEEGFRAAR